MINEVLNEDCVTGLSRFADSFFDLAIVDPPYGINAPNMQMGAGAPSRGYRSSPAVDLKKGRLSSGGGHMKNSALVNMSTEWDKEKPSPEYFKELFRVSKFQIIWGGNYFDLPPTRCIICWDKVQPWENFSQWEMAWTSFDSPAQMYRISNTGGANDHGKIHPTQKPVELYKQVMHRNAFGRDGKILHRKILDTHMGSQTSRIAAHLLGLDYFGFEKDEKYFAAGNKFYYKQTRQINLFDFEH